jgi:serine/threonine protein kinase
MCGPVRRAVHRLSGEEVAIKTLSRQRYRELNMVYPPQELRLLERVRHPNLVRMLDTIWADDDVFIVMELISGGEFFEYCMAAGALPEAQAQVYWRQLVSGVDYLHRGGICHRDISMFSTSFVVVLIFSAELENLVLDSNHNLKLVDFGFATAFFPGEKLKVFCGSPDYAAPELVGMTEYEGPKVDIWAMGGSKRFFPPFFFLGLTFATVCLYVMLTSYIPFSSPASILSYRFQFPAPQSSQSSQQLVKAIFRPPDTRATMDALVVHEWTQQGCCESVRGHESCLLQPEHELHEDIIAEMEESFGWTREAIEAALAAHQVSSQVSTTYHLLDHKRHRAVAPKNPIWKGGKKKHTAQQQACTLQ